MPSGRKKWAALCAPAGPWGSQAAARALIATARVVRLFIWVVLLVVLVVLRCCRRCPSRRREGGVDEADDPGLFDAAVLGSGGGPPGDLGVGVHDGVAVIGGGLSVPGLLPTMLGCRSVLSRRLIERVNLVVLVRVSLPVASTGGCGSCLDGSVDGVGEVGLFESFVVGAERSRGGGVGVGDHVGLAVTCVAVVGAAPLPAASSWRAILCQSIAPVVPGQNPAATG